MGKCDGTMKMPWGRYAGKTIEEIPSSYLQWMVNNIDPDKNEENCELVKEAETELDWRKTHNANFED